jgi:hypothetical protein
MNALATVQVREECESQIESPVDSYTGAEIERVIASLQEQPRSATVQSATGESRIDALGEDKARRWMWGFLIALGAVQIYFVQEMLAALFLFTLMFAVLAAIALVLYAASRASEAGASWIEPYARVAARVGRRGYALVVEISKKPFRRPHSETAR